MPATDPRFLAATPEEMLTDIWAFKFKADPKLLSEVEDEDFDIDNVAAEIGYMPPVAKTPDDWEDLSVQNGK